MSEGAPVGGGERAPVDALVADLFRRESARLVARLTRVFGAGRLALAEEVVQEALIQALKLWPFQGVPENPAAWLATVARHKALDAVRREARLRALEPEVERAFAGGARAEAPAEASLRGELGDDQLALMFTCCHPELGPEARVALTLKTLGGFGVSEIARAFLAGESTIAQRLVRAKRRIRERSIDFGVPAPEALEARRRSVLESLYLMFNEGYLAHRGDALVRADICRESLRLALELAGHPALSTPEVHALCALMMFQAARFPARADAAGDLLLLAEQDRRLWDRDLIDQGFRALARAQAGDRLSRYHLEAGIAACHAAAESWDGTDWAAIRFGYDRLVEIVPSPVVALNRAVAVAMTDGARAGLAALDRLGDLQALSRYAPLPATRGEFLFRLGERAAAADCFAAALALSESEPERRYLARKLKDCRSPPSDAPPRRRARPSSARRSRGP